FHTPVALLLSQLSVRVNDFTGFDRDYWNDQLFPSATSPISIVEQEIAILDIDDCHIGRHSLSEVPNFVHEAELLGRVNSDLAQDVLEAHSYGHHRRHHMRQGIDRTSNVYLLKVCADRRWYDALVQQLFCDIETEVEAAKSEIKPDAAIPRAERLRQHFAVSADEVAGAGRE